MNFKVFIGLLVIFLVAALSFAQDAVVEEAVPVDIPVGEPAGGEPAGGEPVPAAGDAPQQQFTPEQLAELQAQFAAMQAQQGASGSGSFIPNWILFIFFLGAVGFAGKFVYELVDAENKKALAVEKKKKEKLARKEKKAKAQ